MSKIWPRDQIRELLALADATGSARAECASPEEAEKFRFAIYYFRRQTGIGLSLSITLDNNFVVVAQEEMREVTIIHHEEQHP